MDREYRRDKAVSVISALLAVFLPPLAVFLKRECQAEFWICCILTFILWVPGVLYAIYVILKVTNNH